MRIDLDNNEYFVRQDFELDTENAKRITILMDFDETHSMWNIAAQYSMENLLQIEENSTNRISLASLSSMMSDEPSRRHRQDSTSTLQNFDYSCDPTATTISVLTLEALKHYKKFHENNFRQSQAEERIYQPGIFSSSERIMNMLATILHIGMEPDRNGVLYQPEIFACSSKAPFIFELFSRVMWLLSRTRREMKTLNLQDYEKVLKVVEKQVRLVLQEKPIDLKSLTEKMLRITYRTVVEHWQKEKNEEMDSILETNPSVLKLKARFIEDNKKLVFQQRLMFAKAGQIFPKVEQKKSNGYFSIRLGNNDKHIVVLDCDRAGQAKSDAKLFSLDDVTHVVEGAACPLVRNGVIRDHSKALSIIIKHEEFINFSFEKDRDKCYWVDTFNLLFGKPAMASELYYKDVDNLTRMDLMLHLIELQDAKIPKKPPPIPPPPKIEKPPLLPKPFLPRRNNVSNC